MHTREQHLSIHLRGKLHTFTRPEVMAIVNFTPDSFFAASRNQVTIPEDVFCIDAGACSTRPSASLASATEEINRLQQGIPLLHDLYPNKPISIDTFRPEVARFCFEKFGIDMINDISGGLDGMFETVAELQLPYVLTFPGNGVSEMLAFFSQKIDYLARLGVCDILLDPGFGFGKTLEENYEIARNLHVLHTFGLPILVGISRKSMIQKVIHADTDHALNGTSILHTLLLDQGIDVLRVHDVGPAQEAIQLYNFYHKLN